MTWAAWLPGAVAAGGALVVLVASTRAAHELHALRLEAERWRELRPALDGLRVAVEAVRVRPSARSDR